MALKEVRPDIYVPPLFATRLKNIPSHRLKLGNYPTPLQPWTFSFQGSTYKMLVKRDDLTDLTASGNKIRKLEFILPEAILSGNDWLLSFGPLYSNSCRTLAAIGPRIGCRSANVLVTPATYRENEPADGNVFFHKLFGAEQFLVARPEFLEKGQEKLLEEAKLKLIAEYGAANPYIVPMGGSTVQGLFGYIECFQEIVNQLEASSTVVDELFFACGSGGTGAGLAIGKYLSSSPVLKQANLTGFIVWDADQEYFHDYVNRMLKEVGLDHEVRSEDLLTFHKADALGYGVSTEEEIEFIKSVARSSGVVLDSTYTAKAVLSFIRSKRNIGKSCLFLHTGGLFSIMTGKMQL